MDKSLYLFIDESGNFDFSINGTKYFIFSCLSKFRPFAAYEKLNELKYDLIEAGHSFEYFHASEDKQHVRDKVFEIIKTYAAGVRVDSIIIEKRKCHQSLQNPNDFIPKMLGYLLRFVLNRYDPNEFTKVIIFTDTLPTKKNRENLNKGIKSVLSEVISAKIKYQIIHHASKSNYDLQIVDYINWAIFKKWERDDQRSYELIKDIVQSEFDIFRKGEDFFY